MSNESPVGTKKAADTGSVGKNRENKDGPQDSKKGSDAGTVAETPEAALSTETAATGRRPLEELSPVEPQIFEHGSRTTRLVALTFDLCEAEHDHAGFDQKIVNILIKKNANATFFMGGKWAETHSQDAKALAKNPLFEIENHSYSHKVFTKITDEQAKQQVLGAQQSINRITGITPKYFRFPAGKYTPEDLKIVGDCGLRAIQWDVVTGDPDKHILAKAIIREVGLRARGGSIVIMHANGRGWHTAEALPAVIDNLRKSGYKLVTISELLSGQ